MTPVSFIPPSGDTTEFTANITHYERDLAKLSVIMHAFLPRLGIETGYDLLAFLAYFSAGIIVHENAHPNAEKIFDELLSFMKAHRRTKNQLDKIKAKAKPPSA